MQSAVRKKKDLNISNIYAKSILFIQIVNNNAGCLVKESLFIGNRKSVSGNKSFY